MNNNLKGELSVMDSLGIKPNYAALGRKYGMDWRTVKKYHNGYEGRPDKRNKGSKLDEFKNEIADKLVIKRITVQGVYQFMLREYCSKRIRTWTGTAQDAVGHTVTKTVTTKYDCTPPGIDGTEVTYVKPDGTTVSGYCQDNIINQHIDNGTSKSVNDPNASSGLKSVILYRVKGTNREVIYSDRTKANWTVSDTHSNFDVYYEITADEKMVSYYELIVTDFAGNRTTKRLTSQYSLLSWFHTSIDRSSYR